MNNKRNREKTPTFPRRADPTSSKAAQRRERERGGRGGDTERERGAGREESRVGTWPYAKKEKNSWICLFFFSLGKLV